MTRIEVAGSADGVAIDCLARSHPHARLRGLRRWGFDVASAELAHGLAATLADPSCTVLVARSGDATVGCVSLRPLEFETEVFGIRTARLVDVIASGPTFAARIQVATDLIAAIGAAWADQDGRMLISSIDADDHAALVGAQAAGLVVLEAGTSYFADHDHPLPSRHESRGYSVQTHSAAEVGSIPRTALQSMEQWVAHSHRHGHLHADPRLPDGAADAFYQRWMRNTFDGSYADVVYTAWRDAEVVGFLSLLRRPGFLERHGQEVAAPGLGSAIDPLGRGSVSDLYAVITADRPLGARFGEHATQMSNLAVHATFMRYPTLRLMETYYVAHGWVGS